VGVSVSRMASVSVMVGGSVKLGSRVGVSEGTVVREGVSVGGMAYVLLGAGVCVMVAVRVMVGEEK